MNDVKREVFYEVHVKGFSMLNRGIEESKRGKYLGLCDDWSINHYKELGVTVIQMMPILKNDPNYKGKYWSYCPVSLFELNPDYGTEDELKEMIDVLQDNGFKVICDTVYNHSGCVIEGLDYDSIDRYGCGNPISVNTPNSLTIIKRSITYLLDSLGFNGLRFDLASCLLTMPDGSLNSQSPIIQWLEDNYSKTKLFSGECYNLHGNHRWLFPKWIKRISNSIRDQIRDQQQFIHTKEGDPLDNVGFVCCHDGQTLLDNCTFEGKYNLANLENNEDGNNNNKANNCSIEGFTDDKQVLAWRQSRADSMLKALHSYTGNVLLLQGDVVVDDKGKWIGRMTNTQFGNNNVYAMDNKVGWVIWDKLDKKGYEDLLNNLNK